MVTRLSSQVRAAAGYVRISEDRALKGVKRLPPEERQREAKRGIARQTEDIDTKADALSWTVAEIYADNDISASKDAPRPAYDRMLADLEAGIRDAVIVLDLDRLTRKPIELEHFMALHDQHHFELANISGDVDLSTANGRMIARIKGAVARQEADRIAERVSRESLQRAMEGKPHPTTPRSYGFMPDAMTHVPAEVKIIKECADRAVAGESLTAIVADLNDRGVPTVTGSRWYRKTLRAILTRSEIAGLRSYKGEVVARGIWEPILEELTWKSLCEELTAENNKKSAGWNTRKHLMSGIAVCGAHGCGTRMEARKGSYVCNVQAGGCGKVSRNQERVDEVVKRLTIGALKKLDVTVPDDAPAMDDSDVDVARIEKKMEEIQWSYDSDLMVMADYLRSMKAQRDRLADLQKQEKSRTHKAALRKAAKDPEAAWERANTSQRRTMVNDVMEFLVIKPVGKGVRLNVANPSGHVEPIWR